MAQRFTFIDDETITLEETIKDFIAFKEAQQLSPKTLRDYNLYLGDFLSKSHNSLDEKTLTRDTLNYLAALPQTSPARYNHPYSCMNALFNWAVNQDLIRRNPIKQQGLHKKRDDGVVKPATIEDVKTLLDSWDKKVFSGLRNYTIILLMLDTGIRTSEMIQLTNSDIDVNGKQLLIRKNVSKTRKERICYLSTSTATSLKKYMRVKPKSWELLFPTREGNQLRTEGLDLEFNRQCKKLGIKITPYQLRHTFATFFCQNGGDIFTLQQLMGHSDIRMTRRYTEIDQVNARKQHEINSPINALKSAERIVNI